MLGSKATRLLIVHCLPLPLGLLLSLLYIADEPLEDLDVAVHRYVYVLDLGYLCQVLLEVLHVAHQQVALALETLLHVSVFIKHLNLDQFLAKRRGLRLLLLLLPLVAYYVVKLILYLLADLR